MKKQKQPGEMKSTLLIFANIILLIIMIAIVMLYVNVMQTEAVNSALKATQTSVENLASTSKVYFTAQTSSVKNISAYISAQDMDYLTAMNYLNTLRTSREGQTEGYSIVSRSTFYSDSYGQLYAGTFWKNGALTDLGIIPSNAVYKFLKNEDYTEYDIQAVTGVNPYTHNNAAVFYANLDLAESTGVAEKYLSDKGYLLCYYIDVENLIATGLAAPDVAKSQCIIIDGNGSQIAASKGNDMGSAFETVYNYFEAKVSEPVYSNASEYAANRIRTQVKTHEPFLELLMLKQYTKDPVSTYFYFFPIENTAGWYYIASFPEASLSVNAIDYTFPVMIVIFMLAFFVMNMTVIMRQNKRLNQSLQEVKIAKDAAERASQSKTMFLSNMSHDIRTPMNAIVGMTEIAEQNKNDPAAIDECLQKITVSSHLLLGIINDVLDMSRIESGKVEMNAERFSLKEFVDSVDMLMRPQFEKRSQAFTVSMGTLLEKDIISDHIHLQQILVNILSNANKYTDNGGEISLAVNEYDDDKNGSIICEFVVKDNGMGMKEEFQKHIFDAFTREENSTVNKIQGTGLGMAICKKYVDIMGGTITVSSKPGKGSTFTVRLPVARALYSDAGIAAVSLAAPLSDDKPLDFGGKRVLLVEDNAINMEIAIRLLKHFGLTADTAQNGKEGVAAFEAAQPGTYSCVLMDVQMPIMNGYEATRAIRALPRADAQSIPVIAMTANVFREDIENAHSAGMTAHLAKPIDVATLKLTLEKYIAV